MTKELFREDGYLQSCEAEINALYDNAFCVDQTVFYPLGGGQPGDTGMLTDATGRQLEILDCYERDGAHLHIVKEGAVMPNIGDRVTLTLNWQRRYRLMRMHSCLHLLCVAVGAPVTGGSISNGSGRLDFLLPDPPKKETLEQRLNQIIQKNHAMTLRWITDQEMAQQPQLVRTMSVLPPMGKGKVRLVKFGDADLQPCGGTHVANSSEIGTVRVASIKNKGKQNRRVTVELVA